MITFEVGYIDEDGKLAVTTINAKRIIHVNIDDGGKGRCAILYGQEFSNYLLEQTRQLDPLLIYRITDRDVGKELIVARRVP